MTGRPPRKRELSEDERRLWEHAMRETTSLHTRNRRAANPAEAPQAPGDDRVSSTPPNNNEDHAPRSTAPQSRQRPTRPAKTGNGGATAGPATTTLARREARRIARDPESIDARIDLHGMRQREAYPALKGFLRASQARGHRLVLVITGKGSGREPSQSRYDAWESTPFYEAPRGVLRRLVPEWLSKPEMRDVVAAVSPAHQSHGGEGALYVRLRRVAPHSPARSKKHG